MKRLVVVNLVVLAAHLTKFEQRRSQMAELWILTLPAGYELSVQRMEGTRAWAVF